MLDMGAENNGQNRFDVNLGSQKCSYTSFMQFDKSLSCPISANAEPETDEVQPAKRVALGENNKANKTLMLSRLFH